MNGILSWSATSGATPMYLYCVVSATVVMDFEDADHLVDDVAVLVERDGTLQRIDLRALDGIAHRVAIDRLAAGGHALDGR